MFIEYWYQLMLKSFCQVLVLVISSVINTKAALENQGVDCGAAEENEEK